MKLFRKVTKKPSLDTWLLVGLGACIFVMLKTSNDPLPSALKGTFVEYIFGRFHTGNEVAFNLSAAIVSTLLMYYVLVKIPERQKRARVRTHLLKTYDRFKESCIAIFLGLADGSYNAETIHTLSDPASFKDYFKTASGNGMDKWDVAANRVTDYSFRLLSVEMEILYNEFQYTMTVIDIDDCELLSFFKHLSEQLYKWRLWQADYDGTKSAMQFFWQVLAGWSFIDGYATSDAVREKLAKM